MNYLSAKLNQAPFPLILNKFKKETRAKNYKALLFKFKLRYKIKASFFKNYNS